MEAFAPFLLRSVIWLSGFALIYLLFLRNERFFTLNRFYLLAGILASFLLPLLTIRYVVELPATPVSITGISSVSSLENISGVSTPDTGSLLILLYLSGIIFVGFMIIRQSRSVLRSFIKAEIITSNPVKLVRSSDYSGSFSFFSFVFVNPSVTDIEMREIMNHELVHIRQKHWIDLVLGGLLCMLQWFNPLVWIYVRFMRQNHEYIADEVALQRTSDPAVYRATLLNQIAGSPVVSLGNSFNYSLSKKRFEMMKNIIISPYRKMKVLFILPVFAIVLYAFAKPEYQYVSQADNQGTQNLRSQSSDRIIKGTIVDQNGTPLPGASVIVMGTTVGSTSDLKGFFNIENVPEDAAIVVSFVGYKSKVIKSEFVSDATIKMEKDTISYLNSTVSMPFPPPPPPPPPPPSKIKNSKVTEAETHEKSGEDIFVVVEELPEFPGGANALNAWITENKKDLGQGINEKIDGEVYVTFIVTSKGKISTPIIKKSLHPLLDLEALRLVSNMPEWKPGSQNGKPVPVQIMLPVKFKLE